MSNSRTTTEKNYYLNRLLKSSMNTEDFGRTIGISGRVLRSWRAEALKAAAGEKAIASGTPGGKSRYLSKADVERTLIATNTRKLRKQKNLTQADLAARSQTSLKDIRTIERGRAHMVPFHALADTARYLGANIYDMALFGFNPVA